MIHLAQEIAAFVLLAWLLSQLLSVFFVGIQAARMELARKIIALCQLSGRVSFALGYRFGRLVRRFI